jgi:antitoxin FitA
MEPEAAMNMTIKGLPEAVYERLKQRAVQNRRSLNAEAIVALEEAVGARKPGREEILERIRRGREAGPVIDHSRTQEYKEWGRL